MKKSLVLAIILHLFILLIPTSKNVVKETFPVFVDYQKISGVNSKGRSGVKVQAQKTSGESGVVRADDVFQSGNQKPEYPQAAIDAGWEGTLLMRLIIQYDGSVKDSRVEMSSGFEILDQSALEASKTWRLSKFSNQEISVPVRFILE